MAFVFFQEVGNRCQHNSAHQQGSDVGFVMEGDNVHNIYARNLGHKRVVSQTRVQHGAVGAALNSSCCHSRMHAGAHQDRNEDSTCCRSRTGRAGQCHVNGIGSENNARNQQPVDL